MPRRTTFALLAFLLAASLVLSTGAVPPSGSDDVGGDVSLRPGDGDYARLDDDGDLVVDLSASNPSVAGRGVGDDAVTAFSGVFRIRYDGDRRARVWLTDETDAVTFYAAGRPVESPSTGVVLGPNESVSVGVRVNSHGSTDETLLDEVSVHARVAGDDGPADVFRPDRGPAVRVLESNPTARRLAVIGAVPDEPTTVDGRGLVVGRTRGGSVRLEAVRLTPPTSVFNVTARRPTPPSAAPVPDPAVLGRVAVANEGRPAPTRVRFSVPTATLAARDVAADRLVAYRSTADGWDRTAVTVVDRRPGRVVVSTPAPTPPTVVLAAPNTTASADVTGADSPGERGPTARGVGPSAPAGDDPGGSGTSSHAERTGGGDPVDAPSTTLLLVALGVGSLPVLALVAHRWW